MTDPDAPSPIDRLADGALYLAATAIAALVFLPLAGPVAVVCAIVAVALCSGGVLRLPTFMGPAGWLAVLALVWTASSASWAPSPAAALPVAGGLALAALFGVPAAFLLARRPVPVAPNLIGILVVLGLAGLILFDIASGSLLAQAMPGGQRVFSAITALLALMAWPAAAMLYLTFGWRESAVWLAVAVLLSLVGGGVAVGAAAVIGIGFFALAHASPIAARILLFVLLLACGLLPAVALVLFGDAIGQVTSEAGGLLPGLSSGVAGWQSALAGWAESPVLGLGLGVAGGGLFARLLIESGGPGLLLALIAFGLIIHRTVRRDGEGWQVPAASGLLASLLIMASAGVGGYQGWWIGGIAVSAIALAGARPIATSGGAALGSIFDHAAEDDEGDEPEDDGLYHFDEYDDDEDEEYEDDDEDDEESPADGEWDVDPDTAENRPPRGGD